MSTFPPKQAAVKPQIKQYDCPPTSTGKGGLKATIRMKNAGTIPSPGIEKNVNAS